MIPISDCVLLNMLPGEIRNHIFKFCVLQGLKPRRSDAAPLTGLGRGFTVSVLPQWNGPGCIHFKGIGSLPILFVNRQTYDEVSSLVYSMVDELSMGGYILHRNEDPNQRWNRVYSLLEKHPSIQRFTPSVKVALPHMRDDLLRGQWISMGLQNPVHPSRIATLAFAALPGLSRFLRESPAISSLTIIVSVENREPPNFEQLKTLHDIYRDRMIVDIVAPSSFE